MNHPGLPTKKHVYREAFMESSRWDNFECREGDILICTPAKCGTTWTQMICALLIFQKTEFNRPLSDYTPWLDSLFAPLDQVLDQLNRQTHRRFIKTHTPFDGLPYFGQAKYICVGRDPRDAFLSMQSHQENMNRGILAKLQKNASGDWAPPPREPADLKERFRKLISNSCNRDSGHSASTDVLYYVKTFWEFRHLPNILMLHYSDLKADLAGEMRRVAKFLDISIAEELWPSLVGAATFEHMKRNADQLTPAVKENFWKDPDKFFHKGTNGQWHDVLGQQELDLYQQVMGAKLEPELASWLEHGRLAADAPSAKTGGRN